MVGQWFARGIDTAMAIYSIVMSIGFMIAFPVVGSLVQSWGWRSAWLSIGIASARRSRATEPAARTPAPCAAHSRARTVARYVHTVQRRRDLARSRLRRPPSGSFRSAPRSTAWSRLASASSTNRSSPSAVSAPTSITRRSSSPRSPRSSATSAAAGSRRACRCRACWRSRCSCSPRDSPRCRT